MAKSEDSPKCTRRRVWQFVVGSLVVVVVLALWPLKGYRIDEKKFVDALGSPYIGARHASTRKQDGKPVRFDIYCPKTGGQARESFWSAAGDDLDAEVFHVPVYQAIAFAMDDDYLEAWAICFQRSNFIGSIIVPHHDLPLGKTDGHLARECLDVVLEGIEREIPGVTTFYNPPARQLWIDRVRPVLWKHFPKAFAP